MEAEAKDDFIELLISLTNCDYDTAEMEFEYCKENHIEDEEFDIEQAVQNVIDEWMECL
jgi:hypothetical protein